jgi:hypothetical protein
MAVVVSDTNHLKPGNVLEFDESAPVLKATKTISPEAWEQFGKQWKYPWPDHQSESVLDELRGPVEHLSSYVNSYHNSFLKNGRSLQRLSDRPFMLKKRARFGFLGQDN